MRLFNSYPGAFFAARHQGSHGVRRLLPQCIPPVVAAKAQRLCRVSLRGVPPPRVRAAVLHARALGATLARVGRAASDNSCGLSLADTHARGAGRAQEYGQPRLQRSTTGDSVTSGTSGALRWAATSHRPTTGPGRGVPELTSARHCPYMRVNVCLRALVRHRVPLTWRCDPVRARIRRAHVAPV